MISISISVAGDPALPVTRQQSIEGLSFIYILFIMQSYTKCRS